MLALNVKRLIAFTLCLGFFPAETRAGPDSLSDLLYARLKYLSHTQDVLSGNISNTDTPDYISKRPRPFLQALDRSNMMRPGLTVTHPGHIAGIKRAPFHEIENPYPGPVKPNGNNVDIEQEITDMNFNELQHRQATQLTAKLRALKTTALGESR